MPGKCFCCVPKCSNQQNKVDDSISFHRIPKDKNRKEQWIANIRRDEGVLFKITDSTRVCSQHFCQEDFKLHLHTKKRLLKNDAVPTIFQWNQEKMRGKCNDSQKLTKSAASQNSACSLETTTDDTDGISIKQDRHMQTQNKTEQKCVLMACQLRNIRNQNETDKHTQALNHLRDDTATNRRPETSSVASTAPCAQRGNRMRIKKQLCEYAFDCWFSKGRRNSRKHPASSKNRRKKMPKVEDLALQVDLVTNTAPARKRSVCKVLSKSPRFQDETTEEETKRLASYAARYRRYMARESDEQRNRRLQRGRELRDMKKLGKSPEPKVARKRKILANAKLTKLPAIDVPAKVMDPEEIARLQQEYIEFKEYVRNVMPKTSQNVHTRGAKSKTVQQTTLEIKMENSFESSAETSNNSPPKILYSDDPIDLEIALLETAEETFVPVQVINQTYEDFDDMFEFENM